MTDKCVGYINAGGFSAATDRPAGQYDERALVSNAAAGRCRLTLSNQRSKRLELCA
jgi:hypothetical protein